MRGVIKRWGNSAAVRITAAVLKAAQVRLGQPVDVREQGGRIVIVPLKPLYDIEILVAGITDANRHGWIADDRPRGRETW